MTKLAVTLFAFSVAWACAAEIRVRDDAGIDLRLERPAQRIISLAPHITEQLFAAGAGEKVVGAVDYSDYPPAARSIPRVGSYVGIDVERIALLRPDLVVAWGSGNPPALLAKLRALNLPLFITEPGKLTTIAADIQRLGRLAGTVNEANAAAEHFQTRLKALSAHYAAAKPRLRVFYQVWQAPLMTVTRRQIINEVLQLCGGDNVFADLPGLTPVVSSEAVLAANPQVIIASGMGEARPQWLDDWRRWPQLSAVAAGHLYFVPPDLIQRSTPRILDGAEQVCRDLAAARKKLR